jgi:hypothetical protein
MPISAESPSGIMVDYTTCLNNAVSEIPTATEQPTPPTGLGKKSRKTIFAIIGIVAVAAVASALVFGFLIYPSPSAGATIPLSYNFTPGEEMTYSWTTTTTNDVVQITSEKAFMGILSFDGEYYTINETIGARALFEEMNKTGYLFPSAAGIMYAYPFFTGTGSSWQKNETRVGETWQFPLSYLFGYAGNVTLAFGEIQNITVLAGTYKVFRMDVSANNLSRSWSYTYPPTTNTTVFQNLTFSAQVYVEYGTCRLVESDLQESMSTLQGGLASASKTSSHMELVKHTGR